MHSDCFFFTGKSHNICQDYARCGLTIGNQPYIIVSDGCSSSKHTDIGSRIITCAAERNILTLKSGDSPIFGNYVIEDAYNVLNHFPGIDVESLDATLLTAISDEDHTWIQMIGDGALALIDKDNNIEINEIVFPSGAPKYLNYWADPIREDNYINAYGNETLLIKYDLLNSDGGRGDAENVIKIDNYKFYYRKIENNKYKAIILMTDGIRSFISKDVGPNKNLDHLKHKMILDELLGYKGYQGEFVKRRTKRFVKDIPKMLWENHDDVSVAGIFLGE